MIESQVLTLELDNYISAGPGVQCYAQLLIGLHGLRSLYLHRSESIVEKTDVLVRLNFCFFCAFFYRSNSL